MKKIPVIIDCDPGWDDTQALLLAGASDRLDVRAVTAVAGNVGLELTTRNALLVTGYMDWDVAVAAGADRPLTGERKNAEAAHGSDGLLGLQLPETDKELYPEKAWDVIYNTAVECEGLLEIIAVGPLTNIAVAFMKYPELSKLIKRIVIMGGGILSGNATFAAEFNIYADPEAAKRVFDNGVPVYVCPLDLTRQAYMTPEDVSGIDVFGSRQAKLFADVARLSMREISGAQDSEEPSKRSTMHDSCALLFAEDDSYFVYEECHINVETRASLSRGKTITDCYSDKQIEPKNAFLVQKIDRGKMLERIYELIGSF